MTLGCGARTAKYVLCIFNFFVLIAAVAVLGVGIWVLADDTATKYFDIIRADASDGLIRGACIAFIVVGVFASFIAFMGCCGAAKESSCMLITYAITLGCILALQVAAGIAGAVFRSDIEDNLETSMSDTVQKKYGSQGQESLTDAWDFMQIEFSCCGAIHGPVEWQTSDWAASLPSNSTQTVPDSCCVLTSKDVNNPEPVNATACYLAALQPNNTDSSSYVHTEGCSPSFHDWVRSNIRIIIGVAFGLAFIQLGGILCACLMRKSMIRTDYEYV